MMSEHAGLWLSIDVGNSRAKCGLFAFASVDVIAAASAPGESSAAASKPSDVRQAELPECVAWFPVSRGDSLPWPDILARIVEQQSQRGIAETLDAVRSVIAGSNQAGVQSILDAWPGELSLPQVVRSSESFPLAILVDYPRRVGLDRLLNAVAANHIRQAGCPLVIVDCGTATTVDLVDGTGAFCGGAILPGFALSARALHQYTEVLPLISIDDINRVADDQTGHAVLGKNTEAAMTSGIFWGQVGAIRELVRRLAEQSLDAADQSSQRTESARPTSAHDDFTDCQVLISGGGGHLLTPHIPHAAHCPYLALQGLILATHDRVAAGGITNSSGTAARRG